MIALVCPNCLYHLELTYELQAMSAEKIKLRESPAWRSTPVDALCFCTRVENCLKNEGIKTAGDVADKSDRDLLMIPNFGKRSLWEVRDIIESLKDKDEHA